MAKHEMQNSQRRREQYRNVWTGITALSTTTRFGMRRRKGKTKQTRVNETGPGASFVLTMTENMVLRVFFLSFFVDECRSWFHAAGVFSGRYICGLSQEGKLVLVLKSR